MTLARISAQTRAVETAVTRASGGRPVPGNAVSLLVDGPTAYAAMRDVISRASRWIHFENYIIRSDDEGWAFAKLLARKAGEGVRVRVLYDWVGSVGTRRAYWRFLRDAGIEVRGFGPPSISHPLGIFSRDHRKLVLADGCDAVIGGLCIGCEWTGNGVDGGQPWRDTAVRISGPAVPLLDAAFQGIWGAAGLPIPDAESAPDVPARGDAVVRAIVGKPGRERAYRLIELLATGARERFWVTDAYFLAPQRLLQSFRDAARDGVDVRILVPGTSDIPLVRNLTRFGYRDLLRAGVRIFEWEGPMLHAKTIVTDGRWVRVGSSNLNPASLVGNYELDALIDDADLADALEQQFRLDIARASEIVPRPLRGPRRISQRLPAVLARTAAADVTPYRRSLRERRQRATVALRLMASNARRSVFVPAMIALASLAAFFLLAPRITAYVFGVLCVWLAVSAGLAAFRQREQ
ncbi:MAG TPA: phospholipase D-like domain-containing protein [Gemmatimonadales bacterium]|nr:phospholipase D-like domain-containing protein [Gemmatimonadales bacterium]